MLTLSATAIAAAFGTFGITGVGASELFAYPYWCLEKGYAVSPASAATRRNGLRGPRLDAGDVPRRLGKHGCVHRCDRRFLHPGATVLYRQGLHPEKRK